MSFIITFKVFLETLSGKEVRAYYERIPPNTARNHLLVIVSALV